MLIISEVSHKTSGIVEAQAGECDLFDLFMLMSFQRHTEPSMEIH